ncbi:ABC transporter substrate-binding protein [Azospirillum picis]|uniref:Branched-chain amino acid transport system substrate-binding protein n=1 Tax=Azospirillum picis TaxID=488438 RepID=A0ABU0MS05_9PROT|nr:ABC transporter substrate-binding protein [Azospirillum picis]MBP2302312.1 branched-chain amino acid transport system substrate-binding protein [Azospirillum picis]MDQ0535891.1 branched-chain amino acid transport system substrate-binding protein [Azospirillum picis]
MQHRRQTISLLAKAAAITAILAAGLAGGLAGGLPAAAAETGPVRVGEINSYTGLPAFTIPYRQGWQLAVEEVNAKGGVLGGRKLEVISRDDAGKPDDAVRVAQELVTNEKVDLLAGTYFSHIGLAVADFAARNKVPFVAAEPLTDAITWAQGNRYTFRLRPSTYMQAAMLVEEAAKLPAKRWATVAPNYEYGQSAVAWFKQLLKEKRPDVEFVAEQWPAQGKLEAGPTVQALAAATPEAIFNVTFGADLAKLVREGETRGLFRNRKVVSLLTGEPDYLEPMKDEAPEGWIVTGYPWEQIDTPVHKAFVAAYAARFKDQPKQGSLVGYTTMKAIAAAIDKAGSTDREKVVDALSGLTLDSPVGPVTFRASDHQSTMGAFVGTTTVKDGRGTMKDWRYADGTAYLPSDEAARKLRPAE